MTSDHYRLAAISCVVVIVTLFLSTNGFGGIFSGVNLANASIYFLLIVVLGLAVMRRNQILKLQAEIVRKQGQEIELTHAALNAHAMVCLTDADGIITSVNENFAQKYGFNRSDLAGTSISRVYREGMDDPVFNEIGETLKRGKIWTGENEEIASDGSKLFMHCTVVPMIDHQGHHTRTVAIRTDNSEHHRAEKARFLKDLLDHLQDEVYIFDAQSLKMVYANLNAISKSGWEGSDLQQKTIIDADRKMDESSFRSHVLPLINGEKTVVSIDVKRGELLGEISTRLYTGDDGQTLFVSVLRDNTERRQMEQARMESVSVVSHELRTPLTSIKGALRLLNSGALGNFDDRSESILEIAARNTERLLLVVDGILDLEKMRVGKMEFNKASVDLVSFIEDVVAMNKGYGDEHNVKIEFRSDLKTAFADIAAERMIQVLSNLLSNAIKHSHSEGTVRVELSNENNFWRVSVSDDGPGIPEVDRNAVFESFSQLVSHDGKKRKGTGLGLAISQKIVNAHDGIIDYTSEVGKGATFFVNLPIPPSTNVLEKTTYAMNADRGVAGVS
ncbi:PAS domain-containing sensor histidine kinase [Sulfitobacter sp. MF3-043]|uniref:PAS domain-containing sensor histidine kinase n=1 Tax=Sulfitobacter sediminivivens TaxID=3252902 RepID=UPI0036DEC6FC